MKLAIVLSLSLTLSGCGVWERFFGSITGFSEICARGVVYYQFTSGAAPAYTADGKLVRCAR